MQEIYYSEYEEEKARALEWQVKAKKVEQEKIYLIDQIAQLESEIALTDSKKDQKYLIEDLVEYRKRMSELRYPVFYLKWQRQFLEDTSDFIILIGGVGSGKTKVAFDKMFAFLDNNFKNVLITTSNSATLKSNLNAYISEYGIKMKSITSNNGIAKYKGREIRIAPLVKSGDYAALLGSTVGLWLADEVVAQKESELLQVFDRMRDPLGGKPKCIWTGNPSSANNYIKVNYIDNCKRQYYFSKTNRVDVNEQRNLDASYYCPTSYTNVLFDKDYVEKKRSLISEKAFKLSYEAEWVSLKGFLSEITVFNEKPAEKVISELSEYTALEQSDKDMINQYPLLEKYAFDNREILDRKVVVFAFLDPAYKDKVFNDTNGLTLIYKLQHPIEPKIPIFICKVFKFRGNLTENGEDGRLLLEHVVETMLENNCFRLIIEDNADQGQYIKVIRPLLLKIKEQKHIKEMIINSNRPFTVDTFHTPHIPKGQRIIANLAPHVKNIYISSLSDKEAINEIKSCDPDVKDGMDDNSDSLSSAVYLSLNDLWYSLNK